MRGMIGMTLCSGVGAPEVAAPWVDWRFASEIAKFPRAVLRHRFGYQPPEDHNQGEPLLWDDMGEVTPELLRSRGIPMPEIVVAGTPCQAFSVAGARKGLEDARGNLTLKFVEILHAIVDARPDGKLAALWENVPGVLSDKGNAFGCLLGGLVGALDAIPAPAGGSWPSEGMVEGPRARAAWAVLDAQWFGVAQRRERVFVVVDFGGAVDPAAVLLEPDRLRGDSPPSRGAGERIAAVLAASTGGCSGKDDPAGRVIEVAHSLRGEGFDASEDGTGRGIPLIPMAFAENQRGEIRTSDVMLQLTCGGGKAGQGYPAVCAPALPPVSMCLNAGGMGRIDSESETFIPVAFDCKGTEVQLSTDGSHPTLRSMGHSESHQNAGGHAAVAYAIQERAVSENPNNGPQGKGWNEEVAFTLEARNKVQAAATPWAVRRLTVTECARLQGFPDDHTRIPDWDGWRKLDEGESAEEMEAMGFAIKRTKKNVWVNDPDGPQYKAYGNSMAVPVVAWIMNRMRISMAEHGGRT